MYIKSKKIIIVIGMILLSVFAGCESSTASGSTSTPTIAPTATAHVLPTQNPYPPHTGTLVLSDPVKDNSKGYQWDETTIGSTSCGFSQGAYHVKALARGAIICNPEAKSLVLGDLAYEVNLKVIQGEIAGIVFRFNPSNVTGYIFFVDTQQGTYILSVANGTSTPFKGIFNGASSAINKGLNQSNVLAVVANASIISLYINNKFIANAHDSTYTQGQLGIFTADSQGPGDVEASDAGAWAL